jgi:rhodanese-related sulfurtransferase
MISMLKRDLNMNHLAGRMYYNFIIRMTLLIALFVAVIPRNAFSESQANSRLPEFLISVESIIRDRDQKREMRLIDIRLAAEFDKLRVPGSLNVPLFAIKTKTFLKQNKIILFDEGYNYGRIEEECKLLRKAGFRVWIMSGGLYAWSQNGGSLEGDGFARKALNRIPAMHFFTVKNDQDWIILNISDNNKKQKMPEIFPRAIPLSLTKDEVAFVSHYEDVLEKLRRDPFTRVLIIDERGANYDRMERIIRNTSYKDVFFLEGGREAYGKYVTGIHNAETKNTLTLQKNNCPGSCR